MTESLKLAPLVVFIILSALFVIEDVYIFSFTFNSFIRVSNYFSTSSILSIMTEDFFKGFAILISSSFIATYLRNLFFHKFE
jgi:hypothetical protein